MPLRKSRDAFRKTLERAVAPHGAVSRVARDSGLSRATLDKWLRDESTPNLDHLDAIAHALGVSPWEMIAPAGKSLAPGEPARMTEVAELLSTFAAMMERIAPEDIEDVEALLRGFARSRKTKSKKRLGAG